MKEIIDSVTEAMKNRLTNSLYGTFFLSWIIFHWNFIFSMIALDDNKVFQSTGLLKNEYLIARYFNVHDWHFWILLVAPFILTYIIIWKLPKWILLRAYNKNEEYEIEKQIIKISQAKRVEQAKTGLEEQTAKKVTAVAKQVVEQKKIQEIDPTLAWNTEYFKFKNLGYSIKYSEFLNDFYSGNKYLHQFSSNNISYFDVLGLIKIRENIIENLTEKGKFFALKVKEEPRSNY
jgi:K+ transporter